MTHASSKLKPDFYTRDVHTVAKELLGKILVRVINNEKICGKIVEVEAYDGKIDEASHSFNGKTKRNEVMFNGGGKLYVYFTYGMHYCSNVVTGGIGDRSAVLIRGIEPIEGIDIMSLNRYGKKNTTPEEKINLTNGPAKICSAFKILREDNGIDLTGTQIYFLYAPQIPEGNIVSTTRIGIKKSVDLPWRYYIKNNPYVSKK